MPIPKVPDSGNFGGQFRFAPLSDKTIDGETVETSCDHNLYDIPVPQGFVADWFGSWNICNTYCTVSFEQADLKMRVNSSTFMRGTKYSIVVYAVPSMSFIESYVIGSVSGLHGKKGGYLKFSSPFENGLESPYGNAIAYEIVHPSP